MSNGPDEQHRCEPRSGKRLTRRRRVDARVTALVVVAFISVMYVWVSFVISDEDLDWRVGGRRAVRS